MCQEFAMTTVDNRAELEQVEGGFGFRIPGTHIQVGLGRPTRVSGGCAMLGAAAGIAAIETGPGAVAVAGLTGVGCRLLYRG